MFTCQWSIFSATQLVYTRERISKGTIRNYNWYWLILILFYYLMFLSYIDLLLSDFFYYSAIVQRCGALPPPSALYWTCRVLKRQMNQQQRDLFTCRAEIHSFLKKKKKKLHVHWDWELTECIYHTIAHWAFFSFHLKIVEGEHCLHINTGFFLISDINQVALVSFSFNFLFCWQVVSLVA